MNAEEADIDRVWLFFKNEQKANKQLREQLKGLNRRLEMIGNLEKTVRDMELENARLRAEVKRLRAVEAALGDTE